MPSILIIDDDPSVRQLLAFMLEHMGHGVEAAADGAEGIRSYRQEPADVVMCDIYMPGKEGIETIMELRREFPRARIVAMSGGGTFSRESSDLVNAKHLGAVATLQKPFTSDALGKAITQALQQPPAKAPAAQA